MNETQHLVTQKKTRVDKMETDNCVTAQRHCQQIYDVMISQPTPPTHSQLHTFHPLTTPHLPPTPPLTHSNSSTHSSTPSTFSSNLFHTLLHSFHTLLHPFHTLLYLLHPLLQPL
ncbi:hypothetical protein Pmani_022378 [Petrolisthes manimaculis]|uniref:Uncharacterized protein n=1 Tax=Petrolisthes manimaculis TaxID=1843537 RepID=A0AAE1PCV4_9EUCA|nr:hypothetical protein Pmani_022378 [Petrolisthes manimaculis]